VTLAVYETENCVGDGALTTVAEPFANHIGTKQIITKIGDNRG
jgi:hypothetical protein